MKKIFTQEEKQYFIDETWARRFKGNEEQQWYMGYDEFAHWCQFVDVVNGILTLPDGTTDVKYGPFNRSLIKEINLPETVKIIGARAFSGCDGVEKITIPEGVVEIADEAFLGCDKLKSINIPMSVKCIGGSAFKYCDGLKSITIPSGVKQIGEGAFSECKNLETVKIEEGVQSVSNFAFAGCPKLQECVIPKSVKKLGWMVFDRESIAKRLV